MTDDTLLEQLDVALGAVLASRIIAGGVEAPPVPDEALHGALGSSGDYQQARAKVREALDDLQDTVDGDTWKLVLNLEAATNQALAEAIEVAWGLGWSAGSSIKTR